MMCIPLAVGLTALALSASVFTGASAATSQVSKPAVTATANAQISVEEMKNTDPDSPEMKDLTGKVMSLTGEYISLIKKAAGTAASAKAQGITEDQALEIALKHAGLSNGDISALRIHQDFDDDMGVTKYDIEFRVGAREYSYEIDTTTGNIYESEVDIDD